MATDAVAEIDKSTKNIGDLLAFIKKELDADAERHAKLQAAGAGELPHESQTGVTLDLGHKNLRVLPLEVITLIKDKVERLALSHNPQIAVPTQIAQCDRLRYLNIRWNQLVHFPEAVLQLNQLEILDVSKNRITAIPEDIKKLTSLKFLAVSRNRITRLPYALGEMSSLGKLKFDENPIEFPPPEALKLTADASASAFEAEREKDTCQKVKRFLRAAAVKEKLKTTSEEDLSEGNVETPRPPKRVATGGRFPIRPSISGLDSLIDHKVDLTSDNSSGSLRSHARGESSNAPPILKRPGITPLLTGGNDFTRSQSEMVSSSASIRQRRQGYVPSRKPAGGLGSVSENAHGPSRSISSTAPHSRTTSTTSINNVSYQLDISDTTGAFSPISKRFDNFNTAAVLPEYRNLKRQSTALVKAAKRLTLTLSQLERPVNDIAVSIKDDGIVSRSTLERQLFTAQAQVKELERLLSQFEGGHDDSPSAQQRTRNGLVRAAVHSLKAYGAVTTDLKRKRDKIVSRSDGIYLRSLMFKVYNAMVEARNICTVLGFNVRDPVHEATSRVTSQAWSSKSLTPTQPKAPAARRPTKPPILQNINDPSVRSIPPPMMPLSTNTSRSNTMTSQTTTLVPTNPMGSRTNTMRSVMSDGDSDEQFSQIFLKLQAACNLAAQALPNCRSEFQMRKDMAQSSSERIVARHWAMVLGKCDEVIANNRALKRRLENARVNDPGLRYQRDFWQLCDAFVHSWTEFATEVKELSSQRVDISSIKHVMRSVQRQVKDVSKTISSSQLYHHAINTAKSLEHSLPPGLMSPLPSPFHTPYASQSGASTPGGGSGYNASVPATPLSAALGPAVQATVVASATAGTPNAGVVGREYFQEPGTARPVRERERDRDRERNDTPMQREYSRRVH